MISSTSQRILITAALPVELHPIQEALKISANDIADRFSFFITGVGLTNIYKHFPAQLSSVRYDSVINLGTAGAISPMVKIFDLYAPFNFYAIEDGTLQQVTPPYSPTYLDFIAKMNWRSGGILSSFTPVDSQIDKNRLAALPQIEIVDMECFAITQICQTQAIPCYCLKVVTDHASEEAESEFLGNLDRAMSILTAAAIELLRFLTKGRD